MREAETKLDFIENLWRGTKVKTRMCPSCRALVGVSEKVCPLCGVAMGYRPSGIGKFLQNVFPTYAPISYSILTINFCIFLLMFITERDFTGQDLLQLVSGVRGPDLVRWGADVGLLVAQGDWWRLVSAIFIHIGIIHLLFNSYALIFIGPIVEDLLGREKFLVLYIATGVAGFLVSNWYHGPMTPTAGASGAIFGLIGAGIGLASRWAAGSAFLKQQLIHWAIYGFAFGAFGGANNAAHFGGFLSGLALAYLFPNPHRSQSSFSNFVWTLLYWLTLMISLASFVLAAVSRAAW